MIPIIGLGGGGHSKVIIDTLRCVGGYDIRGILDPKRELWNRRILGVPVLGDDSLLPQLLAEGVRSAFIGLGGVGNNRPRRQLYEKVIRLGFLVVSPIHPSAVIAASAEVGKGTAVLACAVINAAAQVGSNVIVNTGAIVEHDCIIGDHVHIATGARLASSVLVGDGSHIGAAACVRQCTRIGCNAVVGAGAVVISDVPDRVIVIGIPARILRSVQE